MSGGNIFLNYRRTDTAGHAGRIFDRLNQRFPGRVFRDVTGIAYGEDFAEEIGRKLESCTALIVLIGPHWLSAPDEVGGRRLDDENDFVRLEIATVLRRKIRVVPVLVGGASMPSADKLPEDLKPLAHRNALEITEPDFDNDAARLIQTLDEALGENDAGKSRVVLLAGLLLAGLGLAAFVAAAVLVSRGVNPSPGASVAPDASQAGGRVAVPSPTPPAADLFDFVGKWDIRGVGTDFHSSLELRADQTYSGRGRFRGVSSEGTGTWERGANPRVVFFRTGLADGSEVVARMEVKEEHEGGYRAAHSYYGDLILRRAPAR